MKRILMLVLCLTVLLGWAGNKAQAENIELDTGSPQTVQITTSGDEVYFTINSVSECVYYIRSLGECDTYCRLYDWEMNLIAETGNGEDCFNFGLKTYMLRYGTYTLCVGIENGGTGTFQVLMDMEHSIDYFNVKYLQEGDCEHKWQTLYTCKYCKLKWIEDGDYEHSFYEDVCVLCGAPEAYSGTCGTGLNWSYDGQTDLLRIYGNGYMSELDTDYLFPDAKHIVVEEGVKSISRRAFDSNSSLETVLLPEGLRVIGEEAFESCSALRSVDIPDSVEVIGENAFAGCTKLSHVSMGTKVKSLGATTFRETILLSSIDVDADNPYLKTVDGAVLSKDGTRIFVVPSSVQNYAVPEGVTTLSKKLFAYRFALRNVLIPASVTTVEEDVFLGYGNLDRIVFAGDAPAIAGDYLVGGMIDVYYPAGNETWTQEYIKQYLPNADVYPYEGTIIAAQPGDFCELPGKTVSTKVIAHGDRLTYRWYKCAPGSEEYVATEETSDTYTLTVSEENMGTRLVCEITDASGAVVRSEPATIWDFPELTPNKENRFQFNGAHFYCTYTPRRTGHHSIMSIGLMEGTAWFYDENMELIAESVPYSGPVDGFSMDADLVVGKTYLIEVDTWWRWNGFGLELDDGFVCYHDRHDLSGICVECDEYIGHQMFDGMCDVCGAPASAIDNPPSVSGSSFSLSFEDEILVNFYFNAENVQNFEVGMLEFHEKPDAIGYDTADAVYGAVYNEADGRYMAQTAGIAAKELGETRYYVAYVKVTKDIFVYSDIYEYSPKKYAVNMLGKDTTSGAQKALCVAMLNYGAAAQEFFGYKVDNLMNEVLTDGHRALVCDYSSDLVDAVIPADEAKMGEFVMTNGGFAKKTATVAFNSAFNINFYFTTDRVVDGDVTFYYWSAEDYESAQVLSTQNCTDSFAMSMGNNGAYWAVVKDIPAKNIDRTIYVCAVYESEGEVYCSGLIAYSLGQYCVRRAADDASLMQDLARNTVVYGYYAKQFFN